MKHLVAAAATLCLALTAPALADTKIYVQLPDLSEYGQLGGMDLLYQLARAEIAIANCPGATVTPEEAFLLSGSIDVLLHLQKVDAAEYADEYTNVALDQLDCAVDGPDVAKAIDALVELGGSRQALPDQAKAAQDDQAMRAAWEAEAAN